jgi:hypothetical protein
MTAPTPKAATLTDNFTALNPAVWTLYNGTVGGGTFSLVPVSTGSRGLTSVAAYDLTESHVLMQLVQPVSIGTVGIWTALQLSPVSTFPPGNNESILWENNQLSFYEHVSGAGPSTTIPYDPVEHQWLRIREHAGTVYWETSPGGVDWTIQQSATPVLNVTSLYLCITASKYTTDPPSQPAIWANFNLTPGAPVVPVAPPSPQAFATTKDTPCTIQALRVWMNHWDNELPGVETDVIMTTDASGIYLNYPSDITPIHSPTLPIGGLSVSLPTPCTLQRLRVGMQRWDAFRPGVESFAQVTSTDSAITVTWPQ